MLYNYNVTDSTGKKVGVLSLASNEIPEMLMDGVGFTLGGRWMNDPQKKFLEFTIMPEMRTMNYPTIIDEQETTRTRSLTRSGVTCENPECPKVGRCGGECAHNF